MCISVRARSCVCVCVCLPLRVVAVCVFVLCVLVPWWQCTLELATVCLLLSVGRSLTSHIHLTLMTNSVFRLLEFVAVMGLLWVLFLIMEVGFLDCPRWVSCGD